MTTVDTTPPARPDIVIGALLPDVLYPLPLYRLVMAAGANRDFNSIHHNSEYARSTGATEAYANSYYLMGMWERAVRDWIGPHAQIKAIRGFRMKRFNLAGERLVVSGFVRHISPDGVVTVEMTTSDGKGVTVGPGTVELYMA